jgi:P-type Ca2+ transporter type 2C
MLSGTKVLEGVGQGMIVAVGKNSFHGKMLAALQTPKEDTPLQEKLDDLAERIAKVGLFMALLLFFALTIRSILAFQPNLPTITYINMLLHVLIQSMTILVVAVPEGLPMAVTLALAFATSNMLQDNNLVRVLAACETMGNATTICSDKTGTLTTNQMTVVDGLVLTLPYRRAVQETSAVYYNEHGKDNSMGPSESPKIQRFSIEAVSPSAWESLVQSIAINTTAFEDCQADGSKYFVGSKTEVALLLFLASLMPSLDYTALRKHATILQNFPFSSTAKSSTIIVQQQPNPGLSNVIQYTKGASEIILAACTTYMSPQGELIQFGEENLPRSYFEDIIADMASRGLRTLGIAIRMHSSASSLSTQSASPEHNLNSDYVSKTESASLETLPLGSDSIPQLRDLTLVALAGIEDPVRPGVPAAVQQCQSAGIVVRMVTGDNAATASAIARQCHILTPGGLVLEGTHTV